MGSLFVLVVLTGLRVVWTLTEGAPNCPVAGNWSDSEGTKTLRIWRDAWDGNRSEMDHFELNTRDYKFVHDSKNASLYNSTEFKVLLANVTGPGGYSSIEKTIIELTCSNNILFVDILPASDMAPQESAFSLRRRIISPLNEAPPAPPVPSAAFIPQFILVNVTLPRREYDDSRVD